MVAAEEKREIEEEEAKERRYPEVYREKNFLVASPQNKNSTSRLMILIRDPRLQYSVTYVRENHTKKSLFLRQKHRFNTPAPTDSRSTRPSCKGGWKWGGEGAYLRQEA